MFKWIRSLFVKRLQVWALFDKTSHIWVKVVSYKRPIPEYSNLYPHHVQGPFRSEVDCEEFCDRQNTALHKNVLQRYQVEDVEE